MIFLSRFHLLFFTCLLIPGFLAGCAATIPAKVTIGGETHLSPLDFEPVAANTTGEPELAFCIAGRTDSWDVKEFHSRAPFQSMTMEDTASRCDVSLLITNLWSMWSGTVVATLAGDGEELMRAEAAGVFGPVHGLQRLGLIVYNAFIPGSPLYRKVIEARKANEVAWQEAVRLYRASPVKPVLPEEARKFQVQAEAAFAQKEFAEAAGHYHSALKIAPWWAEGHFNRALLLGEVERYRNAIGEMRKYLELAPGAPDARAAQDKIYEWERLAAKSAPAQTEMEVEMLTGKGGKIKK